MHKHGPSCLDGPISHWSPWWVCFSDDRLERPVPKDTPRGATTDAKHTEEPRRRRLVRRKLVERIRREIAAGRYDTPEKLEAALNKLAKRLNQRR